MNEITKKELIEALADYPDNAKIIFNDDDNFKALDISEIRYYDDDYTPVLCPETFDSRIFIHLKKHID